MAFPYRIATLIYAFNQDDEVLLIKRRKPPNQGLWSPFGGKLDTATGESPHMCAARETREELAIAAQPDEFHLTGLVSERGYQDEAHWLMFLYEYLPRLTHLPKPIDEGEFAFIPRDTIPDLPIPQTDRDQLWPLFWQHRGKFFVAHCVCTAGGDQWTIEQTEE